ncbi:fimbrial biogenesis chaperone [Klebsiella aerogenes]|uniref:fimbrial biogenesis chaperone n=1 Tax=Klebsiella aerogenes TaxID=548 RepID=UPI00254B96BB|nr:fimbria/pilus periplasmic chaperone [Klebsiella aerogenes]EKZ5287281.1 molecular chaperone [Klebsiella aerogenes]MDK7100952.1 fimbria/pilus periplasmic chaperone [Klebsiella aerogenes]MDK7645678.1 fimbria/pilus periplasmic chaperone [Klebsiella aerogenes]MDK7850714.1 fimbria/pilus periplasmic chaperone [Klebsiella aerogenes]MDK8314176.1 fimbria/pilus periplasmic chaperone [Klebsiella aerogenes]
MFRFLSLFIFWLVILIPLSRYTSAATLQVAPVTLELQSHQKATALYVTNTGATPIHAQIRVYEWLQEDNKDVLRPTEKLISSPAMTSLAPGERQLVRIIVSQPGTSAKEQSFRLVIDELTNKALGSSNPNAVHFLLRYSIPVFITGREHKPASKDDVRCEQTKNIETIRCHNSGARHLRLSNLQALTAEERVVGSIPGLVGYMLPGQGILLTIKQTSQHKLSALRVYLNDDHHDSHIPLHPIATRASAVATSNSTSAR